jgi:hypothetical protein
VSAPPVCEATAPLPDTVQVAWVSPLDKRVGAESQLEVVRVTDLRKLVEAEQRDPTRVLQALGLTKKESKERWKVTIFDVKREWLCRPIDADPANDVAGMDVCEEKWQDPAPGTVNRSYSGCGYLLDAKDGDRTLDAYRLRWRTAVTWGFCVLPLERFLGGA